MKSEATRLQDRIVDCVEDSVARRADALIDAPTGAGKSRMFSRIAENGHVAGERTIILSHRRPLARQALKNLDKWSASKIPSSLGIEGNFDQSGKVVSTTIQTANLHIDEIEPYQRAIIDEAHHAKEENQDYTRLIDALSAANPDIVIVSASATFPDEMENMHPRLKAAERHSITFDEAIAAKLIDLPRTVTPVEPLKSSRTIREIVEEHQRRGHGSDAEGVGAAIRKNLPDDWTETMAWQYAKNLSDRQTLSFFDSIKEAEAFAREVREHDLVVEVLHSGRSARDNEHALRGFEDGRIQGLVSVDMISEGFDVDARGLFLGKLSTSAKDYRQIIGRGARSYGSDKGEKTLLVDMGASTYMHGEISGQAMINNIAKTIESSSRETADLRPESEASRLIWKRVEGMEAFAAPIENAIVYAVPNGGGYIAMQSVTDRKGSRINLLDIEGQKKGRPDAASFRTWSEAAIARSEKAIARLMGRPGGIDGLISDDWQRNGPSIRQSIEMLSAPLRVPAMEMAR